MEWISCTPRDKCCSGVVLPEVWIGLLAKVASQPSSYCIPQYGDWIVKKKKQLLDLFFLNRDPWEKEEAYFHFQHPQIHLLNMVQEAYLQQTSMDVSQAEWIRMDWTQEMHFNLRIPGYFAIDFLTILFTSGIAIPQSFCYKHLSVSLSVLFALYHFLLHQKMRLWNSNLCANSITPLFKILILSLLFQGINAQHSPGGWKLIDVTFYN